MFIIVFFLDNRTCFAEDDFRCITTGACIRKVQVCDGRQHCSDNSDEENCCKLLFLMKFYTLYHAMLHTPLYMWPIHMCVTKPTCE